jgi:Peptidase S46
VINGRGELVSLNFDPFWENVANDFGYNPDVALNVSGIRLLTWLLEVQKADGPRKELRATPVKRAIIRKN